MIFLKVFRVFELHVCIENKNVYPKIKKQNYSKCFILYYFFALNVYIINKK